MGQRSQVYVRIQEGDKYHLIARYFSWNFAERMISRCRHTLSWLTDYREQGCEMFRPDIMTKLIRIIETNFDMHDVILSQDIIQEYYDLNFNEDYPDIKDYVFYDQHNNDGRLLIDVPESGPIKYVFLDDKLHKDHVMNAAQYMDWDYKYWRTSEDIDDEQKEKCKNNIREIGHLAELMTEEEVAEFISCDYIGLT